MILQKEEEIGMAGETLMEITQDDRERARLLSEEKYILDKQNMEVHFKREGKREGAVEIARKALSKGLSFEYTSEITGLDIETIKSFK